jgi:site-specific DNA recombinase
MKRLTEHARTGALAEDQTFMYEIIMAASRTRDDERMKAVGYVRISTCEDKQKYGLKVQLEAIREYCKKEGLDLVGIYRDERSGKSLNRPGIQELLNDSDQFQVVLVYKIDRLSRSVLDLLKLIREKLADKDVVFINEGIDQRTKEGRLLLNQLASFAEYERELIVGRIKDGLAEAKRNGVRLGAYTAPLN